MSDPVAKKDSITNQEVVGWETDGVFPRQLLNAWWDARGTDPLRWAKNCRRLAIAGPALLVVSAILLIGWLITQESACLVGVFWVTIPGFLCLIGGNRFRQGENEFGKAVINGPTVFLDIGLKELCNLPLSQLRTLILERGRKLVEAGRGIGKPSEIAAARRSRKAIPTMKEYWTWIFGMQESFFDGLWEQTEKLDGG